MLALILPAWIASVIALATARLRSCWILRITPRSCLFSPDPLDLLGARALGAGESLATDEARARFLERGSGERVENRLPAPLEKENPASLARSSEDGDVSAGVA